VGTHDYDDEGDYLSYDQQHDATEEKVKLIFMGGVGALVLAGLIYWLLNLGDGITNAEYMRIQEGMTYQEVLAIAGEEPSSMSSSTVMGMTIDQYNWDGEGPLGITQIHFMDGVVAGKSMM